MKTGGPRGNLAFLACQLFTLSTDRPILCPMTSFNLSASYYYGFFGYPSEARSRA
jgi:hypothetical protein